MSGLLLYPNEYNDRVQKGVIRAIPHQGREEKGRRCSAAGFPHVFS
jgi:hypothetical protein